MNTIKVKVNFKKGTCDVTGIKLVTGDYNSTIIKLTMSDVSGTNIFNMKSPSDNLVLSTEIVNGEVPLYRETEEGIKESILAEKGNYTFEIAKYDGDSKLTSAYGKIPVRKAQVNIDKELIEPYLPVFDGLLSELSFLMNQVNNLNIAVEKEGNVTTLTITDKIGEEKVIRILDGEKGDRGERGPRGYDGNPTFYVGDFNDKPSEAKYVVEITDNGVKEHIKNYSDETGEFIDVPRATPTSDMNSTSSMSVPTTQAVKKYVAEHGADATNEISISPNQPTEYNYKLWFPGGTIKTKASEVINSMNGNQTDLAPSVDAVKNYVNEIYSTDEIKTNKIWIDGKPIYRKVLGGTTNASTDSALGSIPNLDTLIDIRGVTGDTYKGGITWINLSANPQQYRQVYVTGTNVRMVQQASEETPYRIILEYTKTTD